MAQTAAVQGYRVDQRVGYCNGADVQEVTLAEFPKGFLPECVRSSQSSVFNLQVQSADRRQRMVWMVVSFHVGADPPLRPRGGVQGMHTAITLVDALCNRQRNNGIRRCKF